jgi:NitT/TauT family transport system ATP-binding protein
MTPASEPIVVFDRVQLRFATGPLVLDGVSFRAARGDFVAVIGPSGCGKSTLLRLIAGLVPPTAGTASVDGLQPHEATQEIGFVFQDPTLLPWLTARRNVELPLRLRGTPAPRRREIAEHYLRLVRLNPHADFHPRQLSGGQKMRVSLARALSVSPRLLLLDEPFGALDEMTRDHLNEELLSIRQEEGWTAFFVTHSVAEAVFLSNRIFIMAAHPGRVHEEIQVPFAYPRTPDTRHSLEYQQLVAEVSRRLRAVDDATSTNSRSQE